jgi:single-strand DNA-binding protein
MAGANINRVILTGRLTRDPELRNLPSGTAVCSLRLAFSTRKKDPSTGEWGEKSNFIDVTIWGRQGELASQYLTKGRAVALDGRLEWREFQTQSGEKRQAIEVVADNVEFLGGREEGGFSGGQGGGFSPRSDIPVDTNDFAAAPVGGGTSNGHSSPADDDIPF